MGKETSKCQSMRYTRGDFDTYLVGTGIDIGCGNDPLKIKTGKVKEWDKPQGDCSYLKGEQDNAYDFVYSSHCIEHVVCVATTLTHWIRVLKPGGCLYITVPDYMFYEKCRWPSVFNTDHKHSFSLDIGREHVKRVNHWNIDKDLKPLLHSLKVRLLSKTLELSGYDWNNGQLDQTTRGTLSQLCLIARKDLSTPPAKA